MKIKINSDAINFFKINGFKQSKDIISTSQQPLIYCGDGAYFHINQLKKIVEAFDLVEELEELGGLERVKNAINGKHIGYTHFYLHSNNRYVFLDHYVDFIPDHVQHIGMFNKVIELVEKCNER